jgi:hypothetical protein
VNTDNSARATAGLLARFLLRRRSHHSDRSIAIGVNVIVDVLFFQSKLLVGPSFSDGHHDNHNDDDGDNNHNQNDRQQRIEDGHVCFF